MISSFWQSVLKLKPFPTQVGLGLLAFLFLSLPGQNYYQTLTVHPQAPKVRAAEVNLLPSDLIPVLTGKPAPYLTARAAIVIDAASGTVLYQKSPDTLLLPASTTKIMTALVALDAYH